MKDLNNQEIEIWHFKWLAQGYVICKQQNGVELSECSLP